MESYAMNHPPEFNINLWGFVVSAKGVLGILAACFIVVFLFGAYRWF